MVLFQKAQAVQQRLRIALDGFAGSGKSFTALRLATGIASIAKSRIAMIDTDGKQSLLYANYFDFDMVSLSEPSPANITKAVEAAIAAGYKVIVVDTASLAYAGKGGYLEHAAQIGETSNNKDGRSHYTIPSRYWNAMMNTIKNCDAHIIVTYRLKEASNKDGSKSIEVEAKGDPRYDYSLYLRMDENNVAKVLNTRCPVFRNKMVATPDEEFGVQVLKHFNTSVVGKEPFVPHQVIEFNTNGDQFGQGISDVQMNDFANAQQPSYDGTMLLNTMPDPVANEMQRQQVPQNINQQMPPVAPPKGTTRRAAQPKQIQPQAPPAQQPQPIQQQQMPNVQQPSAQLLMSRQTGMPPADATYMLQEQVANQQQQQTPPANCPTPLAVHPQINPGDGLAPAPTQQNIKSDLGPSNIGTLVGASPNPTPAPAQQSAQQTPPPPQQPAKPVGTFCGPEIIEEMLSLVRQNGFGDERFDLLLARYGIANRGMIPLGMKAIITASAKDKGVMSAL